MKIPTASSTELMSTLRTLRSYFGAAALLMGTVLSAPAQPREERDMRTAGSGILYEVLQFPLAGTDSIGVHVLYRIPQSFFVFLSDQGGTGYTARGELMVEFQGETAVRSIVPVEVRRNELPGLNEALPDIEGTLPFTLKPGRYSLIVDVKAGESGRSFLDRARRLQIGATGAAPKLMEDPFLGYRDSATGAVVPFNRGGAVWFGSRGGIDLQVLPVDPRGPLNVKWRLRSEANDITPWRQEYTGVDSLVTLGSLSLLDSRGRPAYKPSPGSQVDSWTSAFVRLPLEKLYPGAFTLDVEIVSGGVTVARTYRFPVVWHGMPQSLARFDIAVDALRHIATEDEVDDMVGFLADGGREHFEEFWRKRSPDTSSAYNPVEEEYYRRVDEAIRRFSTRGALDGYKTDRGRIIILFGIPASMERIFRPSSGPREIWTYPGLKKRYIFVDPARTGDYTLTQTEDL